MATRQRQTPGSQDLPAFQTTVRDEEHVFGPLVALSSKDANNLMTFEIGESPDENHEIELSVYDGDNAPPKPGKKIVCTGKCLVSNAIQNVAAYRPTP